jgi:dienelactone hydrolase
MGGASCRTRIISEPRKLEETDSRAPASLLCSWRTPLENDLGCGRLDHVLRPVRRAAELFLYPGHRHLFADNSLPDYDEHAATLLKQHVLSFLDNID